MKEKVVATAEDRALVAKTSQEIREEVSVFSFDMASLNRRVREGDLAQALIQAHLHLDHVISRLVTEHVPFPKHLQLDRASFSQKLQLVAAFGLLRPNHVSTIKVVNAVRNRIAHRLDYSVGSEDEARIRSTLPKGADVEADGAQMSLVQLLRVIVVLTDLERQDRAYERSMRARAVANARVVLDVVSAATERV